MSSKLLEAELRAVFVRQGIESESASVMPLSWVIPDRPLTAEIARVLETGYTRRADCWHLASALYLAEHPPAITFLTLEERQGAIARALAFGV